MLTRIPNELFGTYSDAVVVDMGSHATIYVSGHVGHNASGKIAATSFADEAGQCFANLARSLERCGAGLKDVVRITAYLTSLANYPAYSRARSAAFADHTPASATVRVSGLLLGARLEIDAVAVVKH